jgi:hypothetical protein
VTLDDRRFLDAQRRRERAVAGTSLKRRRNERLQVAAVFQ